MNPAQASDLSAVKSKRRSASPPLRGTPAHLAPTTFFLKTEKELEKGAQRGRKTSRSSVPLHDQGGSMPSSVGGSSLGIQSVEETINAASLPRTTGKSTDHLEHVGAECSSAKRHRLGNRVRPAIMTTGQQIITSNCSSSFTSPVPAEAPLRAPNATSSVDLSQPLTPIKLSPHRAAGTPSTPRSTSLKSFRLSDEESSVGDDASSQAIVPSSGDDERTPQLVMPSLSMPVRRPFTERGRRTGRAKIMVIGPRRVGKTNFIQSVFRSYEHIVHMDQIAPSPPSQSSFAPESSHYCPTTTFTDIQASTRPYPSWWTGSESRRTLRRRSSVGDGVLERNLTFIDTPGLENDDQVEHVLQYIKSSFHRAAHMECMSDNELIHLLSGEGGAQIDSVVYLFDSAISQESEQSYLGLGPVHQELLQYLSKWTNLIPVIAKADTVTTEALMRRKQQVARLLASLHATPYDLIPRLDLDEGLDLLAISSALEDDAQEVDASVLMSSQYMQPLVPSELAHLLEHILEPSSMARMRHISATKFLLWRQQNIGKPNIDFQKQALLQSPRLGHGRQVSGTASLLDDASRVLVPHSSSSYYRSASPAISDASAPSSQAMRTSAFALARHNDLQHPQPSEPFRRVRLAKWAQDLQRSLDNERRKYQHMYSNWPTEWSSSDSEKHDLHAMVPLNEGYRRPARGRLGGDLGVIDPRDPLGVLALGQAFRRRGFLILQIAGGCGLVGAVAYWIARNWFDVQEFLGGGGGGGSQAVGMVHAAAIPAPTVVRPRDDTPFARLFGWCR